MLYSELSEIRLMRKGYLEGLELAKKFVLDNGGVVRDVDEQGVTELHLGEVTASCFQLYLDIDLFYFET